MKKPQNTPVYDYETLHFGFSVAFSTMDFAVTPIKDFFDLDSVSSIEVGRHPGFNLNIISNLRLGEDLDLRFVPGLAFGQRDLKYTFHDLPDTLIKVESIFVEVPLLLKYSAKRLNNHKPYVITGLNYRFDMDGKEINKEKDRMRRLNRSDLYFEIGTGVDFYLPYFKLAAEIKFSVGLFNILKPEPSQLATSIEKMTSKMVVLTFHFE